MSASDLAAPFRDGLKAGRLRYQRCTDCGAAQTLARYACTRCAGTRLRWDDASGQGTVYALSVVKLAPSDSYRKLLPYALALVDLDEGPRIMAQADVDLRIGDRVTVDFIRIEDRDVPRFHRMPGDGTPASA